MLITRSKRTRPGLAIVYGEPGIGKTTLAARIPGCLLLDLEDRAGHVDVDCVRVDDWPALRQAVLDAADVPHRVIALDTLDRAQDLCARWLCEQRGWDTLDAPGYGRGYVELRAGMMALAEDLQRLTTLGKGVLLLAHATRQRVEDPTQGEWDRWTVRLHDAPRSSVAAVFIERADLIGLAAMAVARIGREDDRVIRARAIGRMLYTTPDAGRLAKCIGEPRDLPLDDAPAWISGLIAPAVDDDAREAYRRAEAALGGREAVRRILRERGLNARTMTAADWDRLAAEAAEEEIPE